MRSVAQLLPNIAGKMGVDKLLPCSVYLAQNLKESGADFVCILDKNAPSEFSQAFDTHRKFDKAFDKTVSCIPSRNVPVVYSPVGELTDYQDVRAYQVAAGKALNRAIQAGSVSPLLYVPKSAQVPNTELCTVLGALHELYVPIQLREDVPEKDKRVPKLSVLIDNPNATEIFKEAMILESGRFVARDIGVGDPERMSPPNVETYVRSFFQHKIEMISDVEELRKGFPLFAAVNRAANTVSNHRGRIMFLEYKPPQAKKTLCLVGKGVTYDTGGADIKAGGIMAGMSRDKCGAAAVAGFMQIVQETKPQDVHVIAALCLVRNSVGEESYVSDEIITSRAGVRVRVGNTDAEGRMCMADALCLMKERVVNENLPDPHLFTIATLTGHACLAAGEGYSIVIDNSVARKEHHAQRLQSVGTSFGEPFEVSVLRQDDFDFNAGKVIGEDVLQCNNAASSRTPRGHQVPAAFMILTTGLDKHGLKSDKPIKYTHLDIAASAGDMPKIPTAAPIVALAKTHL